jgi:hypothetical protein
MADRGPAGRATRSNSCGGTGKPASEPGRAGNSCALGLDEAPKLAIVGHDEDAPRARRAVSPELCFDRRLQHAIGGVPAGMLDEEVLSGSCRRARARDSDIAGAIEYELDPHLGREGGAN